MLVVNNVSKRWSTGVTVLNGISFNAAPGTLTAIMGPSGSGKTTLLRLVAQLETQDSGEIQNPFGQPGMVFQEPSLWPHLTLLENVSLPLIALRGVRKSEARNRAAEILSAWGLEKRLHAHPAELSGGQQQRGALARAYVMEPKVLCLDEVTSALDPETAAAILQTLLDWRRDKVTLIVTHQLGFARASADQVLFIDHGEVVESGSAQQVLLSPIKERTRAFISAAEM
jgi:ABC-type polar amino acid transport system ATPase subunit